MFVCVWGGGWSQHLVGRVTELVFRSLKLELEKREKKIWDSLSSPM